MAYTSTCPGKENYSYSHTTFADYHTMCMHMRAKCLKIFIWDTTYLTRFYFEILTFLPIIVNNKKYRVLTFNNLQVFTLAIRKR